MAIMTSGTRCNDQTFGGTVIHLFGEETNSKVVHPSVSLKSASLSRRFDLASSSSVAIHPELCIIQVCIIYKSIKAFMLLSCYTTYRRTHFQNFKLT